MKPTKPCRFVTEPFNMLKKTFRTVLGFVAMALLTSTSCEEEEYKYPYSSSYIDPSEIPHEMNYVTLR